MFMFLMHHMQKLVRIGVFEQDAVELTKYTACHRVRSRAGPLHCGWDAPASVLGVSPRCGHHQPVGSASCQVLRVWVGTVRDVLVRCELWSPKDSSASGRCFLLTPKAVLAG